MEFQKKRKYVPSSSLIVPAEELCAGNRSNQRTALKLESNSTHQECGVKNVGWRILPFIRNKIAVREVSAFARIVDRVSPINRCGGRVGWGASFGNITEGCKSKDVKI